VHPQAVAHLCVLCFVLLQAVYAAERQLLNGKAHHLQCAWKVGEETKRAPVHNIAEELYTGAREDSHYQTHERDKTGVKISGPPSAVDEKGALAQQFAAIRKDRESQAQRAEEARKDRESQTTAGEVRLSTAAAVGAGNAVRRKNGCARCRFGV
jgi:hypothetical protein